MPGFPCVLRVDLLQGRVRAPANRLPPGADGQGQDRRHGLGRRDEAVMFWNAKALRPRAGGATNASRTPQR
jgi:hypothetical protein